MHHLRSLVMIDHQMLRVESWKRMVLIRINPARVLTQVDGLPFYTAWVSLERLATIEITLIHATWKIIWRIKHDWVWRKPEVVWKVRSKHNLFIPKQLIACLMLALSSVVIMRYWRMFAFKVFNAVKTWALNGFSSSNYSLNTITWDRILVPDWRKAHFFFRVLVRQSPNNLPKACRRFMMNYSRQRLCGVHKVLHHCLMRHFKWHIIARIVVCIVYSLNWLYLQSGKIITIFQTLQKLWGRMKVNFRVLIIREEWILGRHSSTSWFLVDLQYHGWKTLNSLLIFFLNRTLFTPAQYRVINLFYFLICSPLYWLRYSSYLFDKWIKLLWKGPSSSQAYTFGRDTTKGVPLRLFLFLLRSELILLYIENTCGHEHLLMHLNASLTMCTWFLFWRPINSDGF